MHFMLMLLVVIGGCSAIPLNNDENKLEADIRSLVDQYYTDEIANDISSSLEEMQSDQPTIPPSSTENTLADGPITEIPDFLQKRHRENTDDERARDQWRDHLMLYVLNTLGRLNSTVPANVNAEKINIKKVIQNFENNTAVRQLADSLVTEKFRSFYPSCEVPKNTDAEIWKDSNEMNLYFDLDNLDGSIATITMRLYSASASQNATTASSTEKSNCEKTIGEEDKLYRVSVFYYTKTLRKNRVKRRLCDSAVIGEHFNWVEFDLKSAIKAWTKGKNLGLAIVVDDQEGGFLRPDTIFKGPSCTVGSSTPKPIPSVLLDSARADELFGINRVDGGNSTASSALSPLMLPTLDICTLDSIDMYKDKIGQRGCSLKHVADEQKRIGRMAASLTMPSARHIRHQKQHLIDKRRQAEDPNDPRSQIIKQQVILTSEQLQNFNADQFNLTDRLAV